MLIPVFNPETDDLERSFLANNYSASTTAISVKNSDRFAPNDRIMIGEMGQEKTEVVTVSSVNVNGTDIVIGPTVFGHSADDPVYKLRFDAVRYYRSNTLTGTYSLISQQPLDVDNEDLETKYDDVTGLATQYYYFTFYHTISTLESANSDIIAATGWRRKQVGNIIDEVLKEVGDTQELHITRGELLGFFNDVNDDITMDNTKPPACLKTRMNLARTAGRNYITYPVDVNDDPIMWKFYGMDYTYLDSTTNPTTNRTRTLKVLGLEDFRNRYSDNTIGATTERDTQPAFMALDDFADRFLFSHPALTSQNDVFTLHFWKFFDVIESEGDVIELPTPKIYKLYLKSQYYQKRAATESSYQTIADRRSADYLVEKNKIKSHNRKDKGSPRTFHSRTRTTRRYRR